MKHAKCVATLPRVPYPRRKVEFVALGIQNKVTYVTPIPWKIPYPKVRQIDVSANLELNLTTDISLAAIMNKEFNTQDLSKVIPAIAGVAESTLDTKQMQTLLNDHTITFDLIIIEWVLSEALSGLSAVYECPFIWSSSVEPHSFIMSLIDEPLNPAYNPSIFSTIQPPFTFADRVQELVTNAISSVLKQFLFNAVEKQQYEKVFAPILAKRGRDLPPFDDVKYNASLALGNSHAVLGQATRLPQNYVPIAGYHIDPKVKPLPDDLKKIMDKVKSGVIYFSMGSNVKSKDLSDNVKRQFLQMFSDLPYTVIWKFEDILPNLPENVHILKWAPQTSILSHPNIKLFITHGGLLSTTEAVYFGVPLVGIPVFGDQFLNLERASNKGFAKYVELSFTMFGDLKSAIKEVLEDPNATPILPACGFRLEITQYQLRI